MRDLSFSITVSPIANSLILFDVIPKLDIFFSFLLSNKLLLITKNPSSFICSSLPFVLCISLTSVVVNAVHQPLIARWSLSLKELTNRPKVGVIQIIKNNNYNNCAKIEDKLNLKFIFFALVYDYTNSRLILELPLSLCKMLKHCLYLNHHHL